MMNTLCRTCLTDLDSCEMLNFYDITQQEDEVAPNVYTILTSILVDKDHDDTLPQKLCSECAAKFELIKEFRDTCILSNDWLIKQLQPIKYEYDLEISKEIDLINSESDDNQFVDFETESNHLANNERIDISNDIAREISESSIISSSHYECDLCGKVFYKRHRIKAHLRQHCGLKPYACAACNKSFAQWSSHQIHQKNHHKLGAIQLEVFRCDFDGCTKFYDLRQTLKVHQERIHLGIKPLPPNTSCVCETCGKGFKSKWFLKAHNFTHGSTEHWPYPCEICPKRFISKYKFKVHMLRHNNIKNFACHLCDLRTCTKRELETHIGYHNKEYSFPCDKCDSMFRSKVALQRHERVVHRGYKPYTCTVCDVSFAKPDTLKHHIMRHTGEKPHACQLCDRRFIQIVALRAHVKTHMKKIN